MWGLFFKQKKVWVGLLFLITLVTLSIGNTVVNDGEIKRVSFLNDDKGQLMGAPFPPSTEFLLGSDRKGYDLLHLVIEGAKWTIGVGVLITVLRIVLGLIFSIILERTPRKLFKVIEAFFDSFSVVPLTMIAYFVLQHVLVFANGSTPVPFHERVGFEIIILTLFAVPTISFYLTNEIKLLFKNEFVGAARVLGGQKSHIFKKHIAPHLFPIILILFMQQFIQVLLILVHLGVLKVFFGGTIVFFDGDIDSVTHEWTGLLGMYYLSFTTHPWIPLVPIIFFTLTIVSSNLILSGIKKSYEQSKIKPFKKNLYTSNIKRQNKEFSFQPIKMNLSKYR